MRKKIRIIVVAGVIAAVGGIAIAARDAKDEGKAAAPPAGAPMAPPPSGAGDADMEDGTEEKKDDTEEKKDSSEEKKKPIALLRSVLSGELPVNLHLEFLYSHNAADLLLLKQKLEVVTMDKARDVLALVPH